MLRKKTYLTLIGFEGEKITVSFRMPEGDKAAQAFHILYLSAKHGNPYVAADGTPLPDDQVDEAAALKYISMNRKMFQKIAGLVNIQIEDGAVEGEIEDYESYMVAIGRVISDALQFGVRTIKADDKTQEQAKEDISQDPTE